MRFIFVLNRRSRKRSVRSDTEYETFPIYINEAGRISDVAVLSPEIADVLPPFNGGTGTRSIQVRGSDMMIGDRAGVYSRIRLGT